MEYLIICIAALAASGLTLFSGFGLGTLLMPVFAIFFTIDLAVAMTALVHLFNNLFKLALMGRHADKNAVLRFGISATIAAFIGASTLVLLSGLKPIMSYQIASSVFQIMPVKLVIAILMVIFAGMELSPRFEKMSFGEKYLPLGGMLSGFFGGLSGHQGALRSAFLARCGLTKESFIATGVVIACMVDISRISFYSVHFSIAGINDNGMLLLFAVLSAFTGSFIGKKLIRRVTMRAVQIIVSIMLFAIALFLGMGII